MGVKAVDRFAVIKRYYDKGIYNVEDVFGFVPKSITAEQFEQITGINYEEFKRELEEEVE